MLENSAFLQIQILIPNLTLNFKMQSLIQGDQKSLMFHLFDRDDKGKKWDKNGQENEPVNLKMCKVIFLENMKIMKVTKEEALRATWL